MIVEPYSTFLIWNCMTEHSQLLYVTTIYVNIVIAFSDVMLHGVMLGICGMIGSLE